jgi:hypothetical protein
MLELDASFDETELGFSKFTRFLRQAHDHEVVNLNKQEGGNYEVSLPGGGAPKPEPSSEPRDERQPGREPMAVELLAPAATESRPVAPSATEPRPGAPSSSGLGPRRGSTRRRHEAGPPALLEGQSAATERSAAASVQPEALGLPTESEDQVRYLTHYRGVGRKTAETLVENFGNEVFDVLQSNPQRLEDVVPAARAQQILEAWKQDYARRLGSGVQPRSEGPTQDSPAGEEGAAPGEGGERNHSGRRRTRRGGRRGGGGRERAG